MLLGRHYLGDKKGQQYLCHSVGGLVLVANQLLSLFTSTQCAQVFRVLKLDLMSDKLKKTAFSNNKTFSPTLLLMLKIVAKAKD